MNKLNFHPDFEKNTTSEVFGLTKEEFTTFNKNCGLALNKIAHDEIETSHDLNRFIFDTFSQEELFILANRYFTDKFAEIDRKANKMARKELRGRKNGSIPLNIESMRSMLEMIERIERTRNENRTEAHIHHPAENQPAE